LARASSGHKHALGEVLQDPAIQSQLADTKYAREISSLESFYRILATDDSRAFYGYDYVVKASDLGAIETLLVTDGLFRSSDLVERKRYIQLVEKVREYGKLALSLALICPLALTHGLFSI
jgi:protein pelota